jgi:DNA modification methylase/ParB-like chromosome segregation protein Spo0J
MRLVPADEIEISPRQRRKPVSSDRLAALTDSILTNGLLHPPVVASGPPGHARLVAGYNRLQAIRQLAVRGKFFLCDGQVVQPGLIPVTEVTDLDPIQLLEAELSENIDRTDLEWQDRCLAIDAIHSLRKQQNPGQTIQETAQELADRSDGTLSSESTRQHVRWATVVAQHLDNPAIEGARNEREAYQLVLKSEEERVRAEIATRIEQPDAPTIIHGDLRLILPSMESGSADLILSDPPYGIGADAAQYTSRTHMAYRADDSPEHTRQVLSAIIQEGYRVAKPRANLLLFCDLDYIPFMREQCDVVGWRWHRLPIVWDKSGGGGYALWGPIGFRHGYDLIFFATKGDRGVHAVNGAQPIDVLSGPRVNRFKRVHGAEKPQWLLQFLIETATEAGDTVLDPCCGSGSTLIAARELNRQSIGIEMDEPTHKLAMANVLAPLDSIMEDSP